MNRGKRYERKEVCLLLDSIRYQITGLRMHFEPAIHSINLFRKLNFPSESVCANQIVIEILHKILSFSINNSTNFMR